jgi:tRNA pseudouridine55 synthase
MTIDGILNVNKPEGKTSFAVVASLRRLTGERRVGHAGTLDPFATGVLPVCFGRGTRIVQFLMNARKTYLAEVELGVATDTFDGEGKITQRCDVAAISQAQIEQVLQRYHGLIEQVPPVYSALKQNGKRCYELARAGVPVAMKARTVEIKRISLLGWERPYLKIEVECSKGTYIRSLADDIGKALGCGGHLKSLVRLQYGHYRLEDSVTLSQIETAVREGMLQDIIYPVDSPLYDWPALIVSAEEEMAIRHGRVIPAHKDAVTDKGYCRTYTQSGDFLAVLQYQSESREWHPEAVFASSECGCAGCCSIVACREI